MAPRNSASEGRFIGQLFNAICKHLPPRAGALSPGRWGTRKRIECMFGAQAPATRAEPRNAVFSYRSPAHGLEIFKADPGPVFKAFDALETVVLQSSLIQRLNAGRRSSRR